MRVWIAIASAAVMTFAGTVAVQGRTPPGAYVRVSACQLAPSSLDRQATFLASMHALPGAQRMEMRFVLRQQLHGTFRTLIGVGGLGVWRKSHANVASFEYAQTVNGLSSRGSYMVRVEFRWLDPSGRVMRTAWRTSDTCSELSQLSAVTITHVSETASAEAGMSLYDLDVLNAGTVDESNIQVELVADGQNGETASIDSLTPSETRTVQLTARTCHHRLHALIKLSDNPLRSIVGLRCPAVH